jgi:tetratricopeptide (TPR) repeat protein
MKILKFKILFLIFSSIYGFSASANDYILKITQESEFQRSQRLKFEEAKPTSKQRLCIHRCDGDEFNVQDADAVENRFLSDFRYNQFQNIQAVLDAESKAIKEADQNDLGALADLYLSRGETFFLIDEYDNAFQDFVKAYNLILEIPNKKEKLSLEFRNVLNFSFIYTINGDQHSILAAQEYLLELFNEICSPATRKTVKSQNFAPPSFILCATPKIHGPEQEPRPGWCKEVVLGTGVLMANIANKAPNSGARNALLTTVAILEHRALECCEAGGLWKACVGPIVEKWQVWNHKWKILGIPPDPAWD